MKAKLVKLMEEWEFSSFKDYCGMRNGTLCNKNLAFELLNISKEHLTEESYKVIEASMEQNIF